MESELDLKSVIDTRRRSDADILLFAVIFILAGIGIAMSYSASAVFASRHFNDTFYFFKRQILWTAMGFLVLLIVQQIDYRFYLRLTKPMLLASFILLIIVLVPGIGHSVKGSARWIGYGPLVIQPSEIVKIFLVIYLAKVFSADYGVLTNRVVQLLIPMVLVAVMFILIMLQPDFGTAMDVLAVSVVILFASGFPLLSIIMLFILSIPMFYLLIYQVSYRRERILAFLNPWADRYGNGYHIIQSFIAFKKGGLFGLGLGYGTQKLSRLPEPHTDFILAVIAEEAGLLGTSFIIALFCLFFAKGMQISMNAPDDFGKLLGAGLTVLIVVQAFINIGVVTGSLPTTGIPLPFISYGGSSLMSSMIASGILLNISRYRDVVQEDLKDTEEVWK